MLLKSVLDGGIVAWGNSKQNSCSFATGSFTQNDRSTLRIFNYDTGYKETSPSVVGWSEAAAPFKSLSWDNFGMENHYSMGVVAGGLADGSCVFWDVASMIEASSTGQYNQEDINYNGCLSIIDGLFEGPVTTVEFNPFKPNLVAVGGTEVLVMDIGKDIAQPQIFSPGSPNPHQGHSITSVSWNRKVQHILASASQNGLTVVWDLKINKSIFNFQDSSAILNRKVSLQWNPEIPTQVAVTYDDERVPELQIWDLRNPQGPVVVFNQSHQQGINCLSWCPSDQSLILTSGRDRQIICWNYKTQEIVRQEHIAFDLIDLKWSNKVSGVYACTGSDGHTDVRSLEGSTEGYAPKWFKPPVAVRYAPSGGQFTTFRENHGSLLTVYQTKDNVPDQDLDSFAKFIEQQQKHDLQTQINNELQFYSDQVYTREGMDAQVREEFDFEYEQWKLIKAISKGDISEYVNTLGFSKRDITAQTENYTGKRHNKKEPEVQGAQAKKPANKPQKGYDFASLSAQDAENFFDQLTTMSIQKEKRENNTPGQQATTAQRFETQGKEIYVMEQVSKNINWDTGVEKIIKDNLVIGNYDGAIDCALKSGRSAEALLLAYSQGKDSFEQTMSAFLTSQTDFFLKSVFKNIVLKQYEEIAKNYELTNWKECAALVLSSGDKHDFPDRYQTIMSQLGERFLTERKDDKNALFCFILGKNAGKCMQIFLKQLAQLRQSSPEYKAKLVRIIKISLILHELCDVDKVFLDGLDLIGLQLAYKALAQSKTVLAYHALSSGPGDSEKVKRLKDLLFHGPLNNEISALYEIPVNPFKKELLNAPKLQPLQQARDIKPIFEQEKKGPRVPNKNVAPSPFNQHNPIAPPTNPNATNTPLPQPAPPRNNPIPSYPPPAQPHPQQSPFGNKELVTGASPPQPNPNLARKQPTAPFPNAMYDLIDKSISPPPQHEHLQQQQQQQQPIGKSQSQATLKTPAPAPVARPGPPPPPARPVPQRPVPQPNVTQGPPPLNAQHPVVSQPAVKGVPPPPPKRQ